MTEAPTDPAGSALVVGAGSGIGRAVAELFASRGIPTVAADLEPGCVKELATAAREHRRPRRRRLGRDRPGSVRPARGRSRFSALGSVDRVVSTVGWTAITPFLEESPDYWRRIVDVNLMSRDLPVGRGGPGHEGDTAAAASS